MHDFKKNSNFALVIELDKHIEILLLSNDCVIIPGFGGFMAHHADAHYDGRDNTFLPPQRTIGFNPQLTMNDSLLAQAYVEAYDISYPEALCRIGEEVSEVRQELENSGKYDMSNLGVIFLNENGNYAFEPYEAGILTPELYGLGGFDMKPLTAIMPAEAIEPDIKSEQEPSTQTSDIQETKFDEGFPTPFDEEEEKHGAEFVQIKKSVLRNMAAACIAVIAFFTLSTPLGNSNVQKSQIDTGMLTRIMPKEMVSNNTKQMVLDNQASPQQEAVKEPEQGEATHAEEEKAEISNATPYYSIVLASRVTKRNAASYAEKLQAKGFKDTKVLITSNNVKVVYGNFGTEHEASEALSHLRKNDAFADGWITLVKE